MDKPAAVSVRLANADKDAPLKEDIRLLGRLLGDVLRHQEGEAVYDVVETIRQTAVRFRREDDAKAGAELSVLLKRLTRDQTISVVRAVSQARRTSRRTCRRTRICSRATTSAG